jgi:hypothetical protein
MDVMNTGWFARLRQFQPVIAVWLTVVFLLPILAGVVPAPAAVSQAATTEHHSQSDCSHHGSSAPEKGQHQDNRCPCCVLCAVGCVAFNPATHSPDGLIVNTRSEQQAVTVLTATAARVVDTIWLDDKPPRGPPLFPVN